MIREADMPRGETARVLLSAVGLLLLLSAGLPLDGEQAGALLCLLLLLVGLPHGALDIERLKLAKASGTREVTLLFFLYLGLAGLTLLVWQLSPVLAMGLFLIFATIHFAEDFKAMPDRLLAIGMAAAILCAPAALHKTALRDIFAAVTGMENGALLAEGMRAMVPVAISLALAGVLGLVRKGLVREASCCAVLLAAMLLAPPIAGFALFFCVFHSPRHLGEAWRALAASRKRLLAISLALTAAAMGLAAALTALEARGGMTDSVIAATFMTLSVLTVPHMLVPLIAARLSTAVNKPRLIEETTAHVSLFSPGYWSATSKNLS